MKVNKLGFYFSVLLARLAAQTTYTEGDVMSDHNNQRHAGLTPEQLDAYWLPYTANRQFKADPRLIVGAEGSYYVDAEGRKIFDGLSGLWCCGAGHNRPEIAEAVAKQLRELDYAPAFQFGHPKAFELAELKSGSVVQFTQLFGNRFGNLRTVMPSTTAPEI